MHQNIMVSYDGSDESIHALAEAKELLASSADMMLSIVQVVSDSEIETPLEMGWYGIMTECQTMDPAVLAKLHDKLFAGKQAALQSELESQIADLPNRIEFCIEPQTISIADSLIDFAEHHDIDLIIMGCRGLGAIRGVLGSVSYAVLRAAKVPVLIVK